MNTTNLKENTNKDIKIDETKDRFSSKELFECFARDSFNKQDKEK